VKRFALASLIVACHEPSTPDDAGADAAVVCASDSECSDGLFCNGEEQCDPSDDGADDRGCVPSGAPACDEGCDEATDACGACEDMADVDGDGERSTACGGEDCDDNDPDRSPGLPEICDELHVDEDCDPTTFGGRDADDDGFVDDECCNGTTCGTDCDDSRANVSVLAPEVCDGFDNDCDDIVDDGVLRESWPDVDEDGYGDMDAVSMLGCTVPSDRVDRAGDCDDDDDTVNPGEDERCGGADEDCDGVVDESADAAAWCASTRPNATVTCDAGTCVVTGCGGGRFDCDGNADSCEIDLCGDPASCDGCGWACPTEAPFCSGGFCGPGSRPEAARDQTLRDADTGLPIAGATITFVGMCNNRSVTTDENGNYALHFTARWARIEAPGYPTHVQPLNADESAGVFGPIVSQARFDAWLADPDLGLTPSADRAIIIADYAPDGGGGVHTTARGFVVRGADGNDLLPGGAQREIMFEVLPGRASIGGTRSESGCTYNCGPGYDLFLEPGTVTYTRGFSCFGVCS
jgi:hypothetical protein